MPWLRMNRSSGCELCLMDLKQRRYFIMASLFRDQLLPELYKSLSSTGSADAQLETTYEQVILLKMLDAALHKLESEGKPVESLLSEDTCKFFGQELHRLYSQSTRETSEPSTKEEEDEEIRAVLCSNDVEVIFLLLQILGTVTSHTDSRERVGLIDVLLQEKVLVSLIGTTA